MGNTNFEEIMNELRTCKELTKRELNYLEEVFIFAESDNENEEFPLDNITRTLFDRYGNEVCTYIINPDKEIEDIIITMN